MSVLVLCLRVNGLKREWGIDLPELTSIQFGTHSFRFSDDSESTELIMRSDDDEMKWWIDLPKLTTLATIGNSAVFWYPRSITLEGTSYHSILTNRHAFSHHCCALQEMGFRTQENRQYKEFLFLPSFIPRHHSHSPTVSPVHCFFHILTPTPNRRFHFTQQLLLSFIIITLSILTDISHVMLPSISSRLFSHFIVIAEINPNTSYTNNHNQYWWYGYDIPDSFWQNTQLLLSWVFHSQIV